MDELGGNVEASLQARGIQTWETSETRELQKYLPGRKDLQRKQVQMEKSRDKARGEQISPCTR